MRKMMCALFLVIMCFAPGMAMAITASDYVISVIRNLKVEVIRDDLLGRGQTTRRLRLGSPQGVMYMPPWAHSIDMGHAYTVSGAPGYKLTMQAVPIGVCRHIAAELAADYEILVDDIAYVDTSNCKKTQSTITFIFNKKKERGSQNEKQAE